jgi:hypothetical protein
MSVEYARSSPSPRLWREGRESSLLFLYGKMPPSSREFCEGLLAAHAVSASMDSAGVEELTAARYAVVVQRDTERWILAASDKQALAEIELESLVGTDGYDEWVVEVWSIAEQRRFSYVPCVVVLVETAAAGSFLPSR